MIEIPPGVISLKDEGSGRWWTVPIAPFLLAATPVTQADYAGVPGPEGQLPATGVSWDDAVRYCNRRSAAEGLRPAYALDPDQGAVWDRSADGYRLPTEAEWEFACRAGSNAARYGELETIAWYRANADGGPHPVGVLAPNAWGLHDMLGNVWEWCWDLYDPAVYGSYRVFRGGGWNDAPEQLRAACRRKSHPTYSVDDLGFRLARSG
ncbi:formylglycine-generating enzyme family protein [Massilia arenosa]|uniref:Formylglycine-generating enzyme family protein n=1 Tax=Zemynaea arenosa TaxID=2561931 RepID=A0A4Y9SNT6_9BURK|nr:SUMF1/EgtB/PvdO family nonheme iron enzyme [Massilia arenosa]TFW28205.1 formylglycine-generating enzyme family protein [Massilia arenosa]